MRLCGARSISYFHANSSILFYNRRGSRAPAHVLRSPPPGFFFSIGARVFTYEHGVLREAHCAHGLGVAQTIAFAKFRAGFLPAALVHNCTVASPPSVSRVYERRRLRAPEFSRDSESRSVGFVGFITRSVKVHGDDRLPPRLHYNSRVATRRGPKSSGIAPYEPRAALQFRFPFFLSLFFEFLSLPDERAAASFARAAFRRTKVVGNLRACHFPS